MLGKAKERMMGKAMEGVTPSESEQAQALATIIAGLEHEQAQALQQLVEAVDVDVGDVHHEQDAREQQLLDTADAVAQGELPQFYLQASGVDSVGQVLQYLQADDWPEQKREWYSKYRERDVVDGPPVDEADQDDIDDAAQLHVSHVFGTTLEEFEQVVVNWDRGAATQQLLAGPIAGHTELIEYIATEIEGDES